MTYTVTRTDNRFTITFRFASHARMAYRALRDETRTSNQFTVDSPAVVRDGHRLIVHWHGRCLEEFESRDFSKPALEKAITNIPRQVKK